MALYLECLGMELKVGIKIDVDVYVRRVLHFFLFICLRPFSKAANLCFATFSAFSISLIVVVLEIF